MEKTVENVLRTSLETETAPLTAGSLPVGVREEEVVCGGGRDRCGFRGLIAVVGEMVSGKWCQVSGGSGVRYLFHAFGRPLPLIVAVKSNRSTIRSTHPIVPSGLPLITEVRISLRLSSLSA